MAGGRQRYRVVSGPVGVAWRYETLPEGPVGPWVGRLHRVRATIDPLEDGRALDPTLVATDIGVQLTEGGSLGTPATPMGSNQRTSIPFDRPIGFSPGITQDWPEILRDIILEAGQRIRVGVIVDAAPLPPDAIMVVTLELEPLS